MNLQTIQYEVKGGVATITLNRPDVLNAINVQMLHELRQVVEEARRDTTTRAVLLTGMGRAFCSGADLAALGGGLEVTNPLHVRRWLVEFFNPIILGIFEMEKPWVAAVNGTAAGAGCQMALACDLVLVADNACFCEIFASRGLVVDAGGLFLLPRIVGIHKAKEISFFAEKIHGPQAVELGIANQCVPNDELLRTAQEWAVKLAEGPTVALGLIKLGMNRGLQMTLQDVMNYEASAQALVVQTQDVQEGLRAFLKKHAPKFQGR